MTPRQAMVDRTLIRKLKIEQQEPNKNMGAVLGSRLTFYGHSNTGWELRSYLIGCLNE